MTTANNTTSPLVRPHGIALPTVMVMLLLSSLVVMTAWRSLWLNELFLQARAEAVRTQWAADAVLHMALDDVLQRAPLSNASASAVTDLRHDPGPLDSLQVFFPKSDQELHLLRERLGTDDCREGICAPRQVLPSQASYWQSKTNAAMAVAAIEGLYANGQACYWVEVFLQSGSGATPAWVYRITSLVKGVKAAQPVVVQAIWWPSAAPSHATENTFDGRWVSWALLHD